MEPLKIGNILLEETCDYCEGEGVDRYNKYIACSFCDEKGTVLTEEGKTIIKLVQKYKTNFD